MDFEFGHQKSAKGLLSPVPATVRQALSLVWGESVTANVDIGGCTATSRGGRLGAAASLKLPTYLQVSNSG